MKKNLHLIFVLLAICFQYNQSYAGIVNPQCQNVTITLDATGNATITTADINNGSSSTALPIMLSLSQTNFSCMDLGPNTVTLTVTDDDGAVGTCNATVTVQNYATPMAEITLCETDAPYNLLTLAPCGAFSGEGVVANTFDPAVAIANGFTTAPIQINFPPPLIPKTVVFKVVETPNPTLQDGEFTCVAGMGSYSLTNLFTPATKGMGTFTLNSGNGMIDGTLLMYDTPGCFNVSYTVADPFNCSPVDIATASVSITEGVDPEFIVTSGNGCWDGMTPLSVGVNLTSPAYFGTPDYEWTVTESGLSVTSLNLTFAVPMITVNSVTGGFGTSGTIEICVTETLPGGAVCGGMTPVDCTGQECQTVIVFQGNCDSECSNFEETDVCGINVNPDLSLDCSFLNISSPDIFDAMIDPAPGEDQVMNCLDEEVCVEYDAMFGIGGLNQNDLPTIGDLPFIGPICSVITFCICLDLGPFGDIEIMPFAPLNIGGFCDNTDENILSFLLDAFGNGQGYQVWADTDGDGNFDTLVDADDLASMGMACVPNNVEGEGTITIRIVGSANGVPAGPCQDPAMPLNLLDVLPIEAIPLAGPTIAAILEFGGCGVDIGFSDFEDLPVFVINNEAPVFLNCPAGYTFSDGPNCDAWVGWSAPIATDLCDGTVVADVVQDLSLAGTISPNTFQSPGTYPVRYIATGCNGMTTECNFDVVVSTGETPVLQCPDDLVVGTDLDQCTAVVTGITPLQGLGRCNTTVIWAATGAGATPATAGDFTDDASGATFELGTTTITYTMMTTDENGVPVTETCTFDVTVEDNQLPEAVCQDLQVQLDNEGNVTVTAVDVDGGSTDNCGVASVEISTDGTNFFPEIAFNCGNIGINAIQILVTDDNGNTRSCLAEVTVIDFFEDFQIEMDVPELCLEANNPSQFDFTNYLTITQPNGVTIPHANVSTLGTNVVGLFGITAFNPAPGSGIAIGTSAADPQDIGYVDPMTGVYTPGQGSGFVTISYVLAIGGQVAMNGAFIEGCYEIAHDVFELRQALDMGIPVCECNEPAPTESYLKVDLGEITGGLEPYRIQYEGAGLDLDGDGTADDLYNNGEYIYNTDNGHNIDNFTEDLGELIINEGETNWSFTVVDARGCELHRQGQCDPLLDVPYWIGANNPACFTDGTFDVSLNNDFDLTMDFFDGDNANGEVVISKLINACLDDGNCENHAGFNADNLTGVFVPNTNTDGITINPEVLIAEDYRYAGTYQITLVIPPSEATQCQIVLVEDEFTLYPSFDACWDMPLIICGNAEDIRIDVNEFNPGYDDLADNLLCRDLDEMSVWSLIAPNGQLVGTGTAGILLQEDAANTDGDILIEGMDDGDVQLNIMTLYNTHGIGQYTLNHEMGIDICKTSCTVVFEIIDFPRVTASTDMPVVCCADSLSLIVDEISGGMPIFQYTWTEAVTGYTSTTFTANGDEDPLLVGDTLMVAVLDLPNGCPPQDVYDFIVTVIDMQGCVGKDTVQVAINPNSTEGPLVTNAIYCQSNKAVGMAPVNNFAYSTSVLEVNCGEDLDGDGFIETGTCANIAIPGDRDGDGIPDIADADSNGPDDDGDGIPNTADVDILCADDDGDGIPNDADIDQSGMDMDADGIPDAADADADGDGVLDVTYDIDGDGINDMADIDMDGDGIIDNGAADSDGDGIPDPADIDLGGVDTDGDGINDAGDADADGDGLLDFNAYDSDMNGVRDTFDPDADGDGIADFADADINGDNTIDNGLDVDKDGINNVNDIDADADDIINTADADIDGDGTIDNGPDTDLDGVNDAADLDDDGDQIIDIADADNGGTDTDGDGIIDDFDNDDDNDEIIDTCDIDNNPTETDSDGDGVIDTCDTDADGDGINDTCDIDQNPGELDSDGDGIIDSCDNLVYPVPSANWYATATSDEKLFDADFDKDGIFTDDADGNAHTFDPVAAGLVDPNVPGTYTFWVECVCVPDGKCITPRAEVKLIILDCAPAEEECTYLLVLEDTGDDGWDGASIDVSINENWPADNYKLIPNECGSDLFIIPITANDGGTIDLTYWNGANESEHSWFLLDPLGAIATDENGVLVLQGPAPSTETIRVKLDCPQNCSESDTYYFVNTLGHLPGDQAWELRNAAGDLVVYHEFGDYEGLAPGSVVVDTVQLSSCEDYSLKLIDGIGTAWESANIRLIGSNADRGTFITAMNDSYRGYYTMTSGPNGLVEAEEIWNFTIPCTPEDCPIDETVLANDVANCALTSYVHPNIPTPYVCYPNCEHANPAPATTVSYPSIGVYGAIAGTVVDLPVGINPVIYEITYADGQIVRCSSEVKVITDSNPVMTCNDLVHISLGEGTLTSNEDCYVTVEPDDVLEAPLPCEDQYVVIIYDENGDRLVPSNVVGPAQAGLTLTYRIEHIGNAENTCWGQLAVEDKLPPIIECYDYEVACNHPEALNEDYTHNETYAVTDLPLNIAGSLGSFIETSVEVGCAPLGERVTSLELGLTHNHTRPADLTVEIEAPNGMTILTGMPFDQDVLDVFEGMEFNNLDGTWSFTITDNDGRIINDDRGKGAVLSLELNFSLAFPKAAVTADCSDVSFNLIDETIVETDCAQGEWQGGQIIRIWQAIDAFGNSSTCEQTVGLKAPHLDEIQKPQDVSLECGTVSNNPADISADISGGVGFDCFDLTQDHHGLCDISFTYEDLVLTTCGNGYKIIRTWTILNWCSGISKLHEQIIKVEDTTGPAINLGDIEVDADNYDCETANVLLNPAIMDACSGIQQITATYTLGGGSYDESGNLVIVDITNGTPISGLPFGTTQIEVLAKDNCGNETREIIDFEVTDNNPPVAVCDDELHVSLGSDGTALLSAEDVDEGSYDNCGIASLEVRRIDGCLDSTAWADTVPFECCDIDELVTVELRVTDNSGNSNVCWKQVLVEDALHPVIICPADKTLDCDDSAVHDPFDEASAIDNCSAELTFVDGGELDQCKAGTLTRTWTASDGSDKSIDVSCTQRITVNHVSDFVVQFPPDVTISTCPDDLGATGEPAISDDDCELLAINHEDLVLDIVDDACYKIERTWTIINWCIYNQGNPANTDLGFPQPLPRTYQDDDGYFTYVQIIKILDNDAPEIDCPTDQTFCDLTDGCEGQADLIITATDGCSDDEALEYTYKIDAFNDGTFDIIAAGDDASGVYPYGTHLIKWIIEDGCGNTSTCTYLFTVEDCKNPTPVCLNGITVPGMNSDGCVDIWASDLLEYAFDNCSSDTFVEGSVKIRREGELTSPQNAITLCCDDLGTVIVEIWVEDETGNADYCTTYIILENNNGACDDNDDTSVAGTIETRDGDKVGQVDVNLEGASTSTFTTDASGQYVFNNLLTNADYSVRPQKDIDPLNGVSTFDLVLMSQHILGLEEFTSPYQMIAADVNNDGNITTFDVVQTRQLILFVINDFPSNTSWRFVDSGYSFPNPQNPWLEAFPELIQWSNLTQSQLDANFMAIKIGDVNGDAVVNNLLGADDRNAENTFVLQTQDAQLAKGELMTIDFVISTSQDITGFQFTLEFDETALELVDIQSKEFGLTAANFGTQMSKQGVLTTSFHIAEGVQVAKDVILFAAQFRAKATANLSEVLNLNSRYTKAEAYEADGAIMDVALTFDTETELVSSKFELYQNQPNPFSSTTNIQFNLPSASSVKLQVLDVQGKVLKVIEGDFEKGMQTIELKRSELGSTGVLYYQIDTESDSAVRKMIVIE